jgi:hypothetical protein
MIEKVLIFGQNKLASREEFVSFDLLVPEEGLEPSRGLTPPDFESGASAIPPLRRCG